MERGRCRDAVCDVVGDDGGNDDTWCSPMITAFSTINYRRRERAAPYVPTVAFLLGYLVVWAGFQLSRPRSNGLQAIGLLTTMMQSSSYYWSAALFAAAGLYQLSPLKEMCLAHCRSPDVFILSEWRDGLLGAVFMGQRHGLFCMGCCEALMFLLFAVAVMDLRWVVGLAILVSSEKLLPGAKIWRLTIAGGLMVIALGLALAGWKSA